MNKRKTFITFIVIIVTVLCVSVFYNRYYHTPSIDNANNTETIVIEEPIVENKPWEIYYKNDIDLDSAREKYDNNEIVAELYVPDLFDVYIAKGTDNDYYLNHNLYKKKDIKGAEYMDYRVDVHSQQINLYGHNSSTFNIPFRKLEKFLDQDFFKNHPYMVLSYDDGESVYEVLSIKEVSTDYEHMKVKPTSMKEHIDHLVDNAIYTRNVVYDDSSRILVLQTCSYAHNDNYYVIVAVEIDKK